VTKFDGEPIFEFEESPPPPPPMLLHLQTSIHVEPIEV